MDRYGFNNTLVIICKKHSEAKEWAEYMCSYENAGKPLILAGDIEKEVRRIFGEHVDAAIRCRHDGHVRREGAVDCIQR